MAEGKQTALYDWHIAQGAKMVPFAGYMMPVQYTDGIVKEHLWTREHAGLFDVSHMGQILVQGADVASALERLLPVDAQILAEGQQRYGLLTNEQGTIDDDLMLTKRADDFYVVVNAACKDADFAKLQAGLPECTVSWWPERALFALQGPEAVDALAELNPAVRELSFMRGGEYELLGVSCWVSRSGYTGEDGFELSVPNEIAVALADKLLADERVRPVGLGARDSLRLEAGLCLYGNDIDTTTTPVEANLTWAIQKVRRPGGERAGDYPGAAIIGEQIEQGAARKRVGLAIDGRAPVRAGAPIEDLDGRTVGEVTSGGFGASVGAPIAMGYVASDVAEAKPELFAMVRNKAIKVQIVPLPFVKKDYKNNA
ncbi:glycine cleavage system aminomethyltransferase GcvT [Suttonella sp. R2A3]|uniref:glycine cleavage system aminomethyltransferase GcvT n=1 Tax=Suttonella sp. R2A3 TaxID=2908648 RepID=UPI001F24BC7E|nr:glycine cleavage system aminomethyltransferase GcvT [Suttonella sp. R2A3]UJF25279.1 glycine cleavage system aminomethyltransferase GcvT [Suttonella sp. R2A3]